MTTQEIVHIIDNVAEKETSDKEAVQIAMIRKSILACMFREAL